MAIGYLLDTNVVSALDPVRGDLDPRAVAWLARREKSIHISVVTIVEIETGIEGLRIRGADRKADRIATWFRTVKDRLRDAIIDIDASIAERAGGSIAIEYAAGRRPELPDALIGATALERDLVLVTRNVRHFETFGIEVIDPFSI